MPTGDRVRYRAPDAQDIEDLLKVEALCFDSYHRPDRFSEKQFHYYLDNENTIASVATAKGNVVGYVLGVTQRGRRKDIARIYSIAVSPEARGLGLGQRLLRRFEHEADKRGASRISLEVASQNKAAQRLFVKAGFRQKRRLAGYYGKRCDGIRMEKHI